MVNSERINLLVSSEEYYFEKLENIFKSFEDYQISNDKIDILIDSVSSFYKASDLKNNKFLEFIEENKEYKEFLELIGQIISICDLNASNKDVFNPYDDKRTIAKAGVRQNDWIINLLKYKKIGLDEVSPSIKATLEYIKKPMNNLTVLSENHKKLISEKLLKTKYSKDTFIQLIKEYFTEEISKYNIKNQKNTNIIISNLIYSKEYKEIWFSEENNDVLVENSKINDKLKEEEMTCNRKLPLNQILYGSPGTGKTYKTIDKALAIIF